MFGKTEAICNIIAFIIFYDDQFRFVQNTQTNTSTSTPRCEAINKMERTDASAGYRNTHYRNGGYDSAKNSAGSLHFVANARVSPRQWNETLCLCMAINLIQKVVKDVNHCNASWHKMRRNVIGCNNYFCK